MKFVSINSKGERLGEIDAADTDTVATVKHNICMTWGLDESATSLVFRGQILKDSKTMAECCVPSGATLVTLKTAPPTFAYVPPALPRLPLSPTQRQRAPPLSRGLLLFPITGTDI